MLQCSRCGEANPTDASFCDTCQSPLSGQLFAPPTAPVSVAEAGSHGQAAGMVHPEAPAFVSSHPGHPWTCAACGRVLSEGDPFCPDDGSPRPSATTFAAVPAPRPETQRSSLRLILPDGSSIGLGDGERLELGRQSSDPRVVAALTGCNGVSRRHATLAVAGSVVTITDHGSMNGTWVNGTPVPSHITLPLGEVRHIRLGQSAAVTCTTS